MSRWVRNELESCYAGQTSPHSIWLEWKSLAPRYKLGYSNKKSASTASISKNCNHLPSILCHAQSPATIIISQSADCLAAYAHYDWRVDSLHTVPQPPNADTDDLVLVCHDSLTFCKMPFFHCLHRPVQGTKHVTPDVLRVYRKNHQFLRPGCLCPLFQPLSKEPGFTKAAIYLPLHGRYKGEWVVDCAKSRCGYLGRSSFSLTMICSYTELPSASREGLH